MLEVGTFVMGSFPDGSRFVGVVIDRDVGHLEVRTMMQDGGVISIPVFRLPDNWQVIHL